MSDPTGRALAAITHYINRADAEHADPAWAAHAILTALRGLGWRPTQIEAPPDWQHRDVTPTPPTADYLTARPPSAP